MNKEEKYDAIFVFLHNYLERQNNLKNKHKMKVLDELFNELEDNYTDNI